MNNTFTVGLSLASIKRKISTQCAWVEITNLATLPPIVNPISMTDIDAMIEIGIKDFAQRFDGYVTDVTSVDDMVTLSIHLPHSSSQQVYSWKIAHIIEDCIVWNTLALLYAPQAQARNITEWCNTQAIHAQSTFLQRLCKYANSPLLTSHS